MLVWWLTNNCNPCPNTALWSKSKSVHSLCKIFSYYVSNGTVKIEIQETSKSLSIMDISDLDKLFPDVDLSPTVWDQQYDKSIAITRGECKVSAASGMDLYLIISIGMKQLDIAIGSTLLGVAGIPIVPLVIIQQHMLCSSFFTSSFCLLLAPSHLFSVSKLSVL